MYIPYIFAKKSVQHMRNKIWSLLFLFCLFSCNSSKQTIIENSFEKSFGSQNSKDLEEFVERFEELVLIPNYPIGTLAEKYRLFAKSCLEKGVIDALPTTQVNFSEFRESQAWNEIYAQVDSVWVGKYEQLDARVIYNSEEGVRNVGTTGYPTRRISDIDSLKTAILDWQVWNNHGKYINALKKIRLENAFFDEYYRIKTTVGEISSQLFCNMLERHNLDFENELIRSIIVVEFARIYIS